MTCAIDCLPPARHCFDYHITISALGTNKYPAKQHAQAAVRHLNVSEGLIYLPGIQPDSRQNQGQDLEFLEDSDQTYPFRQRRYFYYLSGVNEPGCYLTYDIKHDHITLYIPSFDSRTALWTGPKLTIPEAEDRFDVDTVRLTEYLDDDIDHWCANNPRIKICALHQQQLPHLFPPGYNGPKVDLTSLQNALDVSRVIKSPHEISLIRHAVKLSSAAHRNVLHHITTLKSEAEILALFTDICISHGARRQAYTPIVASGTNAAILHYTKNDETLKGKGSVCMDAGCEWECYSSDVTRTFPISEKGWASTETAEINAVVEEMQERCIEQLKPGIAYMDLFILAHRIAIEGLLRLGIFKQGTDLDLLMKKGFSRAFFPHGLGHHIGLEVHDVSPQPLLSLKEEESRQPVWHTQNGKRTQIDFRESPPFYYNSSRGAFCRPFPSSPSLLQEDMVLTVEPGIYFSPPTLSSLYLPNPEFAVIINKNVLDKYMHVGGVRIEDCLLITADGFENLTTAPKGKEMLELVRQGARCRHGVDCSFRAT